jgi:pimeloyl-ACP methyl ester carboxylesterase
MQTELVRVQTEDELTLDGALHSPPDDSPLSLPIEAFLLVHGTGGNFYAPGVLEAFAEQAVACGAVALRVNTRGHDGWCSIPAIPRSVQGGAAFEVISDCRLDLRAWLELLHRRGLQRIALVGHSMGGVKATYTLAHEPNAAVRALILLAAPRFSHRRMMEHPHGEAFRATWNEAQQAVARGEPEQLLTARQPLPCLMTAAGFLRKYGPDDDYDLLGLLPRIDCPILAILGSRSAEGSIAFDGLSDALRGLSEAQPNLNTELIDGANTAFTGQTEVPFAKAATWLRGLTCSPDSRTT